MNIEKSLEYLESIGISLSREQYLENQSKKAIVGMSGGVDSSVCAILTKLMGMNTTGIFMRNWEEIGEDGVCSAEADYQDVIKVCDHIDIPYYSLNFAKEYQDNVFQEFLEEYKKGNTPNPDILCNREIKFKTFYESVKQLGADYLVTGHYCRVDHSSKQPRLLKGLDDNKDQSYFLYAIDGAVLKDVLFPIGHLEKPMVRKIAEDFNLPTKSKKDSTGICFIGERNFKDFLSNYIEQQKGRFINLETNKDMGAHDGSCFYTPGQRKGLGLGGPGGPWFVAGKEGNKVYVVEGEKHPALYAEELWADQITWISAPSELPLKCRAKVRYRQKEQDCVVSRENDRLYIKFDKPQRAISVGQSVVLYSDEICLGGGQICQVGPSFFEQNKLPVL